MACWRWLCAAGATTQPQIKLDVSEDEKAYTVKAETPGVSKDDIHVSVEGNLVSISAEVKKECEAENAGSFFTASAITER